MQKIYAGDKDFYQTILINNGAVGTYLPAATGEAYSTPDEFFGGRAIYEDLSAWMKEFLRSITESTPMKPMRQLWLRWKLSAPAP